MLQDYCTCNNVGLTAVESKRCGENIGQVQILAFENIYDKESGLSTLANIIVKSKWTAALNQYDAQTHALSSTGKIQMSPEVKGWEQAGGDPILWGEDVKANRMPEKVDDNPVQITVNFRGIKQEVARAIDALKCAAIAGNLGVYMFNTSGDVIGVDGTTTLDSFPVGYSNIAPRNLVKDEPDNNAFTFYIERRFWDMMKKVALTKTEPSTDGAWRGIDLLAV